MARGRELFGVAARAWARHQALIAGLAAIGIAIHLFLRFAVGVDEYAQLWPLWAVLLFGGVPLTIELLIKLFRRQFGSDLLAGISIVTAVFLQQYLAGALVVLMLSGGETLEAYAVQQRFESAGGFGSPDAVQGTSAGIHGSSRC